MCKKLFLLISLVAIVGLGGPARAATLFHWTFDGGVVGDEFISDTDIEGGLVATKFYDSTLPAGSPYDVNYGPGNTWYNSGETSADFLNDPCSSDPGVGLFVPDTGAGTPLDLSPFGTFTIEAFIYPYTNRQSVIVRKYGGGQYYIDLRGEGRVEFSINGDGNAAASLDGDITENEWHHVAAVFDENAGAQAQKIYVDGILKGTNDYASRVDDTDRALGIGCIIRDVMTDPCAPPSTGQFFNGRIDEVRFSDEALDPSQFILGAVTSAGSPSPIRDAVGQCPDVVLSWAPGAYADTHDVYFGTDFNDVNDATTAIPLDVFQDNLDVNEFDTTPLALQLGKTYYWRIDEVNDVCDPCLWPGTVWNFTTGDGKAYDPSPDQGYRVAPDVTFTWTPGCLATSHDVYIGTDFNDVNNATTSVNPNVDYVNVGSPTHSASLDSWTTYYWRVDEVDGSTYKGDVWMFRTGLGGLIMYYKFDGFQGNDLPPVITPDEGILTIAFTKYTNDGGSVKYGESNPVIVDSTTSADFDPCAGFYRDDTGENDPLRLDGEQYTIEMWFKVNEGDYDSNDMILIGKGGDDSDSWSIEISDMGDDDDFRWYHNGDDQQVDGMMADMINEWIHCAAVYDHTLSEQRQKFYINGVLEETGNDNDLNPPDDSNTVYIGMKENYDDTDDDDDTPDVFVGYNGFFDGPIDELRIYDIALTPCEFLLSPGPEYAYCPIPYSGQYRVDPNTNLVWEPGSEADTHDVYFGTNYDDVLNATTATAGIYQGNVDVNNYPADGNLALELGRTYYWRVDEVNGGSKWENTVVWNFETVAEIVDANMRAWYKLDAEEGDIARDYSGRYFDADVDGDDDWDPNDGRFGGSLGFNDDTDVECPEEVLDTIETAISVSLWLKDAYRADGDNWAFSSRAGAGSIVKAAVVEEDTRDVLWRAGDSNDVLRWNLDGANPRLIEGWHHWVFRKDEIADTMSIYFDSALVASRSDVNDTLINIQGKEFRLGVNESATNSFIGRMDDARIYDKALSEAEIQALFRGGEVELAWAPEPYDGASEVPIDTGLIWKPGDFAASHDIYFGTSYDDVDDANTAIPLGVFVDNQEPNTYNSLPLFEFGEVYYWRIDEVNGPNTWKGNVWSFTAASFIVIDDFESYNDTDNVIYDTWEDGVTNLNSSSVIWLGTDPNVHGGNQSVEFLYENQKDWWSGHYWSEIVREYDTAQDWTVRDTKILTLYFSGVADNAADETEEMFVALEDAGSTKAVVKYNDYGDANDVKLEDWTEWNIILSDFTNVDMNNVKIMWIGFGDPDSQPTPGGDGTVFFDDIRLYPPKCIPEFGPPEDLSGNCIVDHLDLDIMAEDWLKTDKLFDTYTAPSPGPVGWWKLNEGSGTDAADDGSGNNDGVVEGSYDWVNGYDGNSAIDFEVGRVLVPDAAALRPTNTVSVSAWINLADEQSNARVVVKGPDNDESYLLETNVDNYLKFLIRQDCNTNDCNDYFVDNEGLSAGEWTHVAGTFDGTWMKLYIDGNKVDESNDANGILLSQDTNDLAIGNRSDSDNRPFVGMIDDVRVYDYALSDDEVVYVATDGNGHLPLKSIANLSNTESPGSEAVNLRDFAVLGDAWLDEKLWP